MARIRTIKPEFWRDEHIATLSEPARLLAIGLLNVADDEGYLNANPLLLRAEIFPLTESSVSMQTMLIELLNIGYIQVFEPVDGKTFAVVVKFNKHQKINRKSSSKIKELIELSESSVRHHGGFTTGTGNREQGTGNREHEISPLTPQRGESDTAEKNQPIATPPKKPPAKRFKPPTTSEIVDHLIDRGLSNNQAHDEAERMFNFYESKGWYVGKNKMKCWKSAASNWAKGRDNGNGQQRTNGYSNPNQGRAKSGAALLAEGCSGAFDPSDL